MPGQRPIAAAGAVVLRGPADAREVALIRQARYDNEWSLPKGKLEVGEPAPVAAVREVWEETGLTVRLGRPLDRTAYESAKGPKVVDWWVASVLSQQVRRPDAEVDEMAFVPIRQARSRLRHSAYRDVLDAAVAAPATTPLLVVRHAKAVSRADWDSSEGTRPLTAHGRRQAGRLSRLLAAYGVTELSSSPWLRCLATLAPYARRSGLTVTEIADLTETRAAQDPRAARTAVSALRSRAGADGVPTAVCVHRPTIPEVLGALDLPWRHFGTAVVAAVHLGSDLGLEAVEELRHS